MTALRFNYRNIIDGLISLVSSEGRMTVSFEMESVKKEAVWPNLNFYWNIWRWWNRRQSKCWDYRLSTWESNFRLLDTYHDYEPGLGLALVLTLRVYPCRSLDCEVRVGRVRRFNPKYCSEIWPTWGLAVWVKLISRSRSWSPFLSFSVSVFYAPQLVQYALVISQYYFGYGNTLLPPRAVPPLSTATHSNRPPVDS